MSRIVTSKPVFRSGCTPCLGMVFLWLLFSCATVAFNLRDSCWRVSSPYTGRALAAAFAICIAIINQASTGEGTSIFYCKPNLFTFPFALGHWYPQHRWLQRYYKQQTSGHSSKRKPPFPFSWTDHSSRRESVQLFIALSVAVSVVTICENAVLKMTTLSLLSI